MAGFIPDGSEESSPMSILNFDDLFGRTVLLQETGVIACVMLLLKGVKTATNQWSNSVEKSNAAWMDVAIVEIQNEFMTGKRLAVSMVGEMDNKTHLWWRLCNVFDGKNETTINQFVQSKGYFNAALIDVKDGSYQ